MWKCNLEEGALDGRKEPIAQWNAFTTATLCLWVQVKLPIKQWKNKMKYASELNYNIEPNQVLVNKYLVYKWRLH